jgi:hypothetical protein
LERISLSSRRSCLKHAAVLLFKQILAYPTILVRRLFEIQNAILSRLISSDCNWSGEEKK